MTFPRPGTYTGVRYRGRYALPDVQATGAVLTAYTVMPCTGAAVAACPPLVKVPRAHRLWVFIKRRSRPRITTVFTYDKRSAYLLSVTVWRVDNYRFVLYAQGSDRNLPGEGPVMCTAGQYNPQYFSRHAQAQ